MSLPVIVGADGFALVGEDGLVLDAGCESVCCDGSPNEICCLSDALIAQALGQPRNDCGLFRRDTIPPIFGVRRYCLIEAESIVTINQDRAGNPPCYPGNYTASCRLVQPVTISTDANGNNSCTASGRALFRYQWTECFQGVTLARDFEVCMGISLGCPPIGASTTVPAGSWNVPGVPVVLSNLPAWRALNAPGGAGFGGSGPNIQREFSWSCPDPGTTFVETITERYFLGTDQVGTHTFTVRYRVSHEEACDGSPSPHEGACDPNATGACQPGPEAYSVSQPCNPDSRYPAVLFRTENVRACAVVPGPFGECVKISPDSPVILNPELIDGVVIDNVVNPGVYPTTCCECDPSCPSTPIVPSPCWAGGVRNGITGAWAPNTPFVTEGPCCCNPDDIITITELESVWVVTGGNTETRKIIAPVVIRRGDPWILETLNRITNTATGDLVQNVPQVFGNEFDPIAPFDCSGGPWSGSVNAQGFGPGQLQIPQGFVGLHTAADGGVRDMPCPIGPDGTGNSVTVLSKNVSVTCTTFAYDGLWEWEGGSRVTHRLRLSITPAPNSQRPECSGGCGQTNGGGVAGPGNGAVPFPSPGGAGIGGILGGCGSCGRAGEL